MGPFIQHFLLDTFHCQSGPFRTLSGPFYPRGFPQLRVVFSGSGGYNRGQEGRLTEQFW